MTIVGAFFVYLYCFLLPYARIVLAAGAAAGAMYVLGPTWQQVDQVLQSVWNRSTAVAGRLTPKTLTDWGVLGLGASFAFLAIGFGISLKKQPDGNGGDGATVAVPIPPADPPVV